MFLPLSTDTRKDFKVSFDDNDLQVYKSGTISKVTDDKNIIESIEDSYSSSDIIKKKEDNQKLKEVLIICENEIITF